LRKIGKGKVGKGPKGALTVRGTKGHKSREGKKERLKKVRGQEVRPRAVSKLKSER